MMVPPWPRSTICVAKARLPLSTPRRLTPKMLSQCAGVVSRNRPAIPMPALFTRMSTTPCSSLTCAASAFIADSSLTSAWYTAAPAPASRTAAAVSCAAARSRSTITTVSAPWRASSMAVARPIPAPAPVIRREFASHVSRPGSLGARDRRRRAVDDAVDPFAGQPGDDVGTRRHHPVPALDRNDPAAQRNRAGEPLQRGRDENVLARHQHLDRDGGLRQRRAGRQKRCGHVGAVQIEPVDVVAGRSTGSPGRVWVLELPIRPKASTSFTPTPARTINSGRPGVKKNQMYPDARNCLTTSTRPRGLRADRKNLPA